MCSTSMWIRGLYIYCSSCPPQDQCSCRQRLHLELAFTLWLSTAASSCSACSSSTTHRRSSRGQRHTRTTVYRNMTPSTRKSLQEISLKSAVKRIKYSYKQCSVLFWCAMLVTSLHQDALLILQVYGDLYGHDEHLHQAGDDSVQRWRRQTEVNSRNLASTSVLMFHRAKQRRFYY